MPYRISAARSPGPVAVGPDGVAEAMRRARRNRRAAILALATVGAAVTAGLVVDHQLRSRRLEEAKEAYAEVVACMVGPEPFQPAATPYAGRDVRVRRRQLTAIATPPAQRIDEGANGWPMRCSTPANRLSRAAASLGEEDLSGHARSFAHDVAKLTSNSTDFRSSLADFEARATSVGLAPIRADVHAVDARPLPRLADPLTLARLAALAPPRVGVVRVAKLDDATLLTLAPDARVDPQADKIRADPDWPGVVHVDECAGGKCRPHIVSRETFDGNDPALRAIDRESIQVGRAGTSVVVAWRGGVWGGLRLRVAPLERLATTPDVVVFDDLDHDGTILNAQWTPPTLDGFRVLGGPSYAHLVLVTQGGTWIVRVMPDGHFEVAR